MPPSRECYEAWLIWAGVSPADFSWDWFHRLHYFPLAYQQHEVIAHRARGFIAGWMGAKSTV